MGTDGMSYLFPQGVSYFFKTKGEERKQFSPLAILFMVSIRVKIFT